MTADSPCLLAVEIILEQDVVVARQRARQLCATLGFESLLQTQVATAVSEIARNAFEYAHGGRAEFFVNTKPHPAGRGRMQQTLIIVISDRGPGIANLEEILSGRYRSKTGLGVGIVGTQKLMDRVEINSTPQGTAVTLAKVFPASVPFRSAADLEPVSRQLPSSPAVSPLRESQVQNQELIRALDESRLRREELERVNQELADTNTGVVVLYDELDTLHRISMMLASKLELKPLIQSIIDVTTTLTDADLGAFFFYEENAKTWRFYAASGLHAKAMEKFPEICSEDLFGTDFAARGMTHVPDLHAAAESEPLVKFAAELASALTVRSVLTVPVLQVEGAMTGALVFASLRPNVFTERCERILASVALQAAIGIEKAQLFQSVTSANEAKDQFFATLSHELRTPLNPVMAVISSLSDDPRVHPELREDMAMIWRNIRLEARLIDDLLDYNRLVKGKMQLTTEALDAHALIEGVIAICQDDLSGKHHRLIKELQAARSTVVADAARLQQVLWNVLKNAIKFTPTNGAIQVRTSMADRRLKIEITDNGQGIDAEDLKRIFSAFDQGHGRPAAQFGGLGLGLAIAQMFVELHQGVIYASSPGRGLGATVTVEIPLAEVAETAVKKEAPAEAAAAGISHGRILLVDDHADTLNALSRLLKRRGYEVQAASSGHEALAAVRQRTFDLLISDLGLPDCSGLALVTQIREIQKLPAVALSGYGMEADRESTRRAGFQTHLTKPVDFDKLLTAVSTTLEAGFNEAAS